LYRLLPALIPLLLVACGRLGFDAVSTHDASTGTQGDAMADAAADAPGPMLIHQYSLNNSFADDLGGPDLTALGGIVSATGYMFPADMGLSLTNAVPASVYSIDILFSFDVTTGYNKLVDFKNRGSDAGLYVYNQQLQFVVIPITGCPGNDCYTSPSAPFADFAAAQVTVTRDATGLVTCFVARQPVLSFDDSMTVGTFDMAGSIANFFMDDTVTGGNEASPGTVTRIRIYNGPLAAAQIQP
jgi:hypothetical protein